MVTTNEQHNDRVSCVDQVTISVCHDRNLTVDFGRGPGGTVAINGDMQTHAGDGETYAKRDVNVLRIGGNLNVMLPRNCSGMDNFAFMLLSQQTG